MARVQEDPEERVAEAAIDDLLERAAGLADAQRLVPLGDRLEVRPDEPVDVVPDPVRQLRRVLDDEPGAAVSAPQIPNATVNRSPRSIGRSPGLSRPSEARGPAVSIRWQDSGVPFQPSRPTASRSVSPDAGRAGAAGRRSMSGTRPHSSAASWSTSLMTRSPSAGSMRRSVAFSTSPPDRSGRAARRRGTPARRSRSGRRRSSSRRARHVLPVPDPLVAEDVAPAAATGRAAGSAG